LKAEKKWGSEGRGADGGAGARIREQPGEGAGKKKGVGGKKISVSDDANTALLKV